MSKEIYAEQILDSRDIISRIDDLESILDDAFEEYKESFREEYDLTFADSEEDFPEFEEWLESQSVLSFDEWKDEQVCENGEFSEEAEEYKKLKDLEDECGSREWRYGITFIRDDYFDTYAQEFAEDCGYIARDVSWPYTHIDWAAAADDLKQDYSSVEFDGETYWYRD